MFYWEFEYIPSQPLEYNETGLSTNLTAMLAFYAYIIIGMDYDTMEKEFKSIRWEDNENTAIVSFKNDNKEYAILRM